MGQLRRIDALPLGQAVLLAYDRGERIVNQGVNRQRRVVDGPAQETDIDAVLAQPHHLLNAAQFGELELDVGILPVMRAHDIGQHSVDGRLHRADVQMTELAGAGAACGGEGSLGVGKRQARLLKERGAGVGQLDRSPGPIDQCGAQLALQLLDLLTQRRLRNV
ncbi:hypothetical protein A5634_00480 [Mycobacterium asiaticum]|uniref:Uncharacterized protein n=1 Tax=Mycobacterium asiaticum TaxID=1790 RepID=A0A1A3NHN6_MYCAS|nr:hypothetical protein A5634_00480 [Mycobacterium asiaticum]